MEYCSGGDLSQAIRAATEPFPEWQVLTWFAQIALALQLCHHRRVLHRDMKSQNVYLTDSLVIKLGDFGIARVLESTLELATSVVGTPYTMSPEVCNSAPYSYKSDMWALGYGWVVDEFLSDVCRLLLCFLFCQTHVLSLFHLFPVFSFFYYLLTIFKFLFFSLFPLQLCFI